MGPLRKRADATFTVLDDCQDALASRRIGGAGLDVFAVESLTADHPCRTLPNVLAKPHIRFMTEENYSLFFRQSSAHLVAFMAGAPIDQSG